MTVNRGMNYEHVLGKLTSNWDFNKCSYIQTLIYPKPNGKQKTQTNKQKASENAWGNTYYLPMAECCENKRENKA